MGGDAGAANRPATLAATAVSSLASIITPRSTSGRAGSNA